VHEFGSDFVLVAIRPDAEIEVPPQPQHPQLHLGERPDVAGEHGLADVDSGTGVAVVVLSCCLSARILSQCCERVQRAWQCAAACPHSFPERGRL
jgi:hypothetical protein